VNLLAKLVYTSSAGSFTCFPNWFIPAWQAVSPACRTGLCHLGRQVNLLAELVYNSTAGRQAGLPNQFMPDRQAGKPACQTNLCQTGR
jgi:hypothetical protein